MQDNRPSVYEEGDTVVYRASAIGGCLKALWAARSNFERRPLPQVVQQGMDEGTNLEPHILDLLYNKYDFTFSPNGEQHQVELYLGAWNGKTLIVRGKVDEVGCPWPPGNRPLPIDVKAFPEDTVNAIKTKGIQSYPRYDWQQSVYAHGFEPNRAANDYRYLMPIFHKGTWQIEEWSLEPRTATYSMDQIRDRVLQVEEAYANNVMPEECDNDFGCAYFYLHEQKPIDVLPDETLPVTRARITLANRIATLDQARKELDRWLKDRLVQDVTYHLDDYTISVFANPKRFNTDQAKALLTEADIDWQNEEDFWIPGNGIQIRFNPPKKGKPNAASE